MGAVVFVVVAVAFAFALRAGAFHVHTAQAMPRTLLSGNDSEDGADTGPTGIVLLPNGEPASDAEVVLSAPGKSAYIRDGERIDARGAPTARIGPDGRVVAKELRGERMKEAVAEALQSE